MFLKKFNEKKGELNYPEIIISSIDLQYYAKLLYEKEFSKVSKVNFFKKRLNLSTFSKKPQSIFMNKELRNV